MRQHYIKADNLEYQDVLCEISRICEQFTSSLILQYRCCTNKSFNMFNTTNLKEFLDKET